MKNENDIIIHRFEDLAERSLCNYTPTYTDFLDMNEQSILSSSYFPCSFTLYGGYEMAERKIACFNEEELTGEAPVFPAVWLKISPTAPKFANELSHRDFLGALMNLGLERCVFGDLIINENTCFVYTLEKIAPYILESLTTVSRTKVSCQTIDELPAMSLKEPEEMTVIASSNRADALIASVYNLSRNDALSLIESGKVFINSVILSQNHKTLKENDTVSTRGFGRFVFVAETDNKTRSGKSRIVIKKY